MPRTPEPAPSPLARATNAAIRRILGDRRMSQADLARGTTLSPNYIAERLRDEKSFTLSDIEQIGQFLGVDGAALVAEAALNVGDLSDTAVLEAVSETRSRADSKTNYGLAAQKDPTADDEDDTPTAGG